MDPGVQLAGALVIGAGAGSTRIDVIECQRQTVIVETDNRDIFDPATGLFSAVSVTKVTEGRLTYRVRAGTPGAGLPANVQGWLPLCVARVPSTATSVDDMTFWDVRPLVKDRISGFTDTQQLVATLQGSNQLTADNASNPAQTIVAGFSTSQIGMYRCGGIIGTPLVGVYDAQNSANQGAGFASIAGLPWYLYAVFPGNLPRWVRYLDAPSPRTPIGPLGVITVQSSAPADSLGTGIINSVNVPLATGLLVTGPGAVLAVGINSATPAPAGFLMRDGLVRNAGLKTKAATSSTATTDTYTFTAGTDFPLNAKSVVVLFVAALTGGSANGRFSYGYDVDVLKPTTTTVLATINSQGDIATFDGSGNASISSAEVEIPTVPVGTIGLGYASSDLKVTVKWAQTSGTSGSPSAFIVGWRI